MSGSPDRPDYQTLAESLRELAAAVATDINVIHDHNNIGPAGVSTVTTTVPPGETWIICTVQADVRVITATGAAWVGVDNTTTGIAIAQGSFPPGESFNFDLSKPVRLTAGQVLSSMIVNRSAVVESFHVFMTGFRI